MKRLLTFGMTVLVLLLFVSTQVYSGSICCASGVSGSVKSSATEGSATVDKAGCAHVMTPEQCAKICGMTPEQCSEMCKGQDNATCVMISVEGMTDEGCSKAIETVLNDIPGVVKVMKADHEKGHVLVCTDLKKVKLETLTDAIISKGYKVKTAASSKKTTVSKETPQVTTGSHPCGAAAAKACAASGKTCKSAKTGCSSMKTKQTSSSSGSK